MKKPDNDFEPFGEPDEVISSLVKLGAEMRADIVKRALANPLSGTKMIDGITIRKVGREYVTNIPIPQGTVVVKYSEIMRARQSFDTVISVQLMHAQEGELPAFEQRLDLNSASGVSNFVTSLNGAYGGKKENFNWTLLLNRSNNVLKKIILEEKQPMLAGEDFTPVPFLLKPFLQKDVPNMVFGNSEVGKTYFALYMAACAAAGNDFFGHPTVPFKTLLLDFEDSHGSFSNRLHELSTGLAVSFETLREAIHYHKPEASIKEETEVVAKMVEEGQYGLIIIDAGSDASGGSPNDETKVLEMFNALNNIPCTKLIIHHEPKNVMGIAAENAYYGTAFWRARVRVAWRLTVETHDGFKKILKATATKTSNMAPVPSFNYEMVWGGGEVGVPSVRFGLNDDFQPSDEARIINFLSEGEAGTETIADAVGLSRSTTQRKLSEMLEKDILDRRRDDTHVRRILWRLPTTGENL